MDFSCFSECKILNTVLPFFPVVFFLIFVIFLSRYNESLMILWERKEFTKILSHIYRVKYHTQEGNVSVELQSPHNSLDFGKASG